MPSPWQQIETALDHARQLADVATDWNLDDVEIDEEVISTYALLDEFKAALDLVRELVAIATPPDPAMNEPEWSDQRIWASLELDEEGGILFSSAHATMTQMRDDYEGKISQFQAAYLYYIHFADYRDQFVPKQVREAITKLATYGMPLGMTNGDWKHNRDTVEKWFADNGY